MENEQSFLKKHTYYRDFQWPGGNLESPGRNSSQTEGGNTWEPPEPQARASVSGELGYNSAGLQIKRALQKASAAQRTAWIVRIVRTCLGCRRAHMDTDISKHFLVLIQKVCLWIIKWGRQLQPHAAVWIVLVRNNTTSFMCIMRCEVQSNQ